MDFLRIFNKTETASAVARAFDKDHKSITGLFQGLYSNSQAPKAGVLVTDELQKAIDDCTARVDRISKACRARNRKFRDTEFDLESERDMCLHGLDSSDDGEYSPADVRRVADIFHEPKFFVDGAGSGDVVQGALGDCWFLSSLAIMGTSEGLIEKCCVKRDEKVGVYGFIFLRNKSWVPVIIDDLLYTKIRKYEDLGYDEQMLYHQDKKQYNDIARKGSKTLYFASSGTQGETWVPLIEKAYAKLHGNYSYLNGGWVGEGVEDMTGGISSFVYVNDILDTEDFWKQELLNVNKDRLYGCGFSGTGKDGLMAGHAYSILRAVEYRGKRFLVIRNPWGHSEWTGPWADGSKEWTQGEGWLDALPVLGHGFGDDGEFVMEYSDFLQTWERLYRVYLFDSTWVMSTHWVNVKARQVPAAWSHGDVSFTFSIPKATKAIISLSQVDDRYFKDLTGRSTWFFDFILYKAGESEPISESSHSANFWSRSVNIETDLEQGDYVVHVRLERNISGEEGWFHTKSADWDKRKLSRILTQRAQSISIAQNFEPATEAIHTPLPLSILAGQDITTLERKAKEVAEAKLKEAGEEEKKETGETNQVTTTTTVTETTTTTVKTLKVTAAEPTQGSVKGDVEGTEEPGNGEEENNEDNEGSESGSSSSSSSASTQPPVPVDPSAYTISDDQVVLGLAVYTHKDAPAVISGQVRDDSALAPGLAGLALAGGSK